jgi:DNA mismatch repair protein MutS
MSDFSTPMMRQWSALKAQAGDDLLFFRLGDFYELFDTDAQTAAPVMGVVLTSRNQKSPDAVALCGVPLHQFENYVGRLLDRGFGVAVAEQVEEPQAGKTLVRREIVQRLSPGIRFLANEDRNFSVAALSGTATDWTCVVADVNTGQVRAKESSSLEDLDQFLKMHHVADLRLIDWNEKESLSVPYQRNLRAVDSSQIDCLIQKSMRLRDREDFPVQSARGRLVAASLLQLLADFHPAESLSFFVQSLDPQSLATTAATRRNLHLFEPAGRSLFDFINRTLTAMGRRELLRWLQEPTQNQSLIRDRQKLVHFFKTQTFHRQKMRERLREILDLHRLIRKERGPQPLIKLRATLRASLQCLQLITEPSPLLNITDEMNQRLLELVIYLEKTLCESEKSDLGWIHSGVDPTIDELRDLQKNSDRLLIELEQQTKEAWGVPSLKVKFHQSLGYVFECSLTHREKIPPAMKIVQNLTQTLRIQSPELKQLEEKVLSVESRLIQAEQEIIRQTYARVFELRDSILLTADLVGRIDALQSLAEISSEEKWTTPQITTESSASLKLQQAKHPLIPQCVPLSLELSSDSQQVMLITGPNMSGKSSVLRLASLCAYLHQIGSDVPAQAMSSILFDRIMCRMGAQDDLASGQSTFFVEMNEVAHMLQGATEKSFLVLDEIGRGTSTFDGMSLAWAISEEIHESKMLALFATHYLELAELERKCPRLKPYHLGVEEKDGRLAFSRRLIPGPASRSYGIQVARLAHVPERVLERASQKLHELEKSSTKGLPLFEWGRSA